MKRFGLFRILQFMPESNPESKPKSMIEPQQKPLPIRFDPVSFADHERKLEGLIAAKAMLRLRENVLSSDDMVEAKLVFSRGYYGYPLVTGQVKACVAMKCERCLDEVRIAATTDISVIGKPEGEVVPLKEGVKEADLPDIHEYDGQSLVLSDLVEEELLLNLPLVPKHQDISLCNQDMVAWLAANEAPSEDTNDDPEASTKRQSPFAILTKR